MGYVVDLSEADEERSATLRFVPDSAYRSAEDVRRVERITQEEMQRTLQRCARAKGSATRLSILACGVVRRHVFVDFKIESTGAHFVVCARCFKVSRMYRDGDGGLP